MEHGPARGGLLLNVHTEHLVVAYPSLPTESKRFDEDGEMIHQKLLEFLVVFIRDYCYVCYKTD